MKYSKSEIELLKKYHPECLEGKHVPVAVTDKHHRVKEVICQNCMIPLTKEDHIEFFKDKGRIDVSKIDWKGKFDPKDLDTYSST